MCLKAHAAPQHEKTRKLSLGVFIRVAGPGIEPGSGGYEPPEVPLLYPAISTFIALCTITFYVVKTYTIF